LNNGVTDHSKSLILSMASFIRSYSTLIYQSVVVTIAVFCTIFEIFHVEEYLELEI